MGKAVQFYCFESCKCTDQFVSLLI